MTADTLTPTLTLAALNKLDGAADPTPFTFGIDSRVITFPDPMAMSVQDTEEFMADIEGATALSEVLHRWVSDDDYQLITSSMTTRQVSVLVRQVSEHYQQFLGARGEGTSSSRG